MAKPKPFLVTEFPYLGCGLGKDPRFVTLEAAERSARRRTEENGEPLNIVRDGPDQRVVLATVRRDANARVWTDLANEGAPLL